MVIFKGSGFMSYMVKSIEECISEAEKSGRMLHPGLLRRCGQTVELSELERFTKEAEEYLKSKELEPYLSPIFKMNDPVLVSDSGKDGDWVKANYAFFNNGKYNVFFGGKNSWTSDGKLSSWKFCKPASNE